MKENRLPGPESQRDIGIETGNHNENMTVWEMSEAIHAKSAPKCVQEIDRQLQEETNLWDI